MRIGDIDYIGLWEQLNNENFNFTEFREIKNNINAQLIKSGLSQKERLIILNKTAKNQLEILNNNKSIKKLEILEKQINNKELIETSN